MQRLTKAMELAIHGVRKDCNLERFANSFPQLARDNSKALSDAHQLTMQFFESSTMESFKELAQQRDIVSKLNALDALLEKLQTSTHSQQSAPVSKKRPCPDQVAASYRYNIKKLERDRLMVKLSEAKTCTESQLDQIEAKQKRVRILMHELGEKKNLAVPIPTAQFDSQGNIDVNAV
ncbi:hypothetical protein BDEG_22888 [Batrachochytrium dendrobatidis JEL423]|nr:hypothetical protein BDEG_22888 [Batrachochytrium dendrobatidis JEL423]